MDGLLRSGKSTSTSIKKAEKQWSSLRLESQSWETQVWDLTILSNLPVIWHVFCRALHPHRSRSRITAPLAVYWLLSESWLRIPESCWERSEVSSHVQHMTKILVGWSLRAYIPGVDFTQCPFYVFLRRSLFVMVRRRERPKKSIKTSRNALQASNDEQAGRP
jgi:hypothetical protein